MARVCPSRISTVVVAARTLSPGVPLTVRPVLIWLNLNSKEEVDELHKVWSASQARIVAQPESKPWKLHEFTVADLDGNLFRVFYDFSRDA